MNSSAVVRALTVTRNPLRPASFLPFASPLTIGPQSRFFFSKSLQGTF